MLYLCVKFVKLTVQSLSTLEHLHQEVDEGGFILFPERLHLVFRGVLAAWHL